MGVMRIAGDFLETVFNAFQVQIEFWMRISNFFEVRESFVCALVDSRFGRWLIVRHSCYPPRRATKPRSKIPRFKVVLKRILMESTECQSPLESRRITQVNCPKSSECRNAGSQTKRRLFALIRNAIILPHAQPARSFPRSDSHLSNSRFLRATGFLRKNVQLRRDLNQNPTN